MIRDVLLWGGKATGLLVGLYTLCLVFLYFAQGRLLFIPPNLSKDDMRVLARNSGADIVQITAEDGTPLQVWHYPSEGHRVVIYAHGNGGNLADALPLKAQLQRSGWDVLAVGYRGYPGSGGSPSEAGLRQDIRAVYEYAMKELGLPHSSIVMHGRSMGGGVVGTVMLDVPVAGLVMQSTFTSAVDRAAELYPFFPVRWLMKNPFETVVRAPECHQPVLILHSQDDEVIPVEHARVLSKAFPQASYVEVTGYGHNDDFLLAEPSLMKGYLSFLDKLVPRANTDD